MAGSITTRHENGDEVVLFPEDREIELVLHKASEFAKSMNTAKIELANADEADFVVVRIDKALMAKNRT